MPLTSEGGRGKNAPMVSNPPVSETQTAQDTDAWVRSPTFRIQSAPVRPRDPGTTTTESLGEVVARGIRGDILEGRLAPGTPIRQEVVAAQYGTSRIPVREALQILAAEGLVAVVPNVGGRVAQLDLAELDEMYQLREQLEPFLLAESVPAMSDEQIGRLEALVESMEEVVESGDFQQWLELDRQFHLGTYAAAPLPRFGRLVENIWNNTQQYRRLYAFHANRRYDISCIEHRLILDALTRRDAEDAQRLLQTHIHRMRMTLLARKDLFDPPPSASSRNTKARKR